MMTQPPGSSSSRRSRSWPRTTSQSSRSSGAKCTTPMATSTAAPTCAATRQNLALESSIAAGRRWSAWRFWNANPSAVKTVSQNRISIRNGAALPTNSATTHTPYEIKVHRIEKFLATLFEPGDLVELRGHDAPDGKTRRILTSDFHVAARVAVLMEKQGCNTYYCVNPVNPDRD